MPPPHSAGGAEGRADPAVRPVQRLEVVHVLRSGLAGLADRAGPEVPEERAGLVVDLDDAAGQGRVAGRPDHRHHGLAAGHRHDAVRDDVAALRDELVVDRPEGHSLAAALDVEDVDPAREQAGHEQSLLIGRVAVVVELVADVRHVDPVHDLAEVSATRIRPDHRDEIRIVRALRDRADVEESLLPLRRRSSRRGRIRRARCAPVSRHRAGSRRTRRRPPRPAPPRTKAPTARQWFEFSSLTSWSRSGDPRMVTGGSSDRIGGSTHLSPPVCPCSAARAPTTHACYRKSPGNGPFSVTQCAGVPRSGRRSQPTLARRPGTARPRGCRPAAETASRSCRRRGR